MLKVINYFNVKLNIGSNKALEISVQVTAFNTNFQNSNNNITFWKGWNVWKKKNSMRSTPGAGNCN